MAAVIAAGRSGQPFRWLALDNLSKKAKKLQHAKSPGVTGWTEELLVIALSTPSGASAITQMTLALLNNDIDADLAELLRMSRLVALPKPAKPIVISFDMVNA